MSMPARWLALAVLALGLVAGVGEPAGAGASPAEGDALEMVGVETGTFEGRIWIRVRLAEPFPRVDEKFSAAVAFSLFNAEGVHLSGSTQIHAGSEDTGGFCEPDSTTCPQQPPEVSAELSSDRMVVTFFMTVPPDVEFDPETLTFRVRTFCMQEETDPGPVIASFPADDQPVPFDATERDPASSEPEVEEPEVEAPDEAEDALADEPRQGTTTEGDGGDAGGFLRLWMLLLAFLVLLLLAGFLIWHFSGGAGVGRPATDACDWALYISDGVNRWLVRPPDGHECCVYTIHLRSAMLADAETNFRQADAGADDDRLRIPQVSLSVAGLSYVGEAGARSGPPGDLDWMQGLGDATETARADAGIARRIQATRGDSQDVGAHLFLQDLVTLLVTLETMCEGLEHRYLVAGRTTPELAATQECTNDAEGTDCAVELAPAGALRFELWEAGTGTVYAGSAIAGYDADEVSVGATRDVEASALGAIASWDPHDHTDRERGTISGGATAIGLGGLQTSGRLAKDSLHLYLEVDTAIDIYAAQIVPPEVWATTERVTTHTRGALDHTITIDAGMITKRCDPGGCCGHDRCKCKPSFKLTVDRTGARLEVDGHEAELHPPQPPVPGGAVAAPWRRGH